MKKLISLVAISLLSLTIVVNAQSEVSAINIQEVDTLINNVAKTQKGKYQFGVSLRYGTPYSFIITVEEGIIISNGYRFGKRNYLGLNVGVAKVTDVLRWEKDYGTYKSIKYLACPISLEYIHYFPVGKAREHAVMLGAEVGCDHSFGKSYVEKYESDTRSEKAFVNPIAMIKVGMEHPVSKRVNLNWSLNVATLLGLGASIGITI